MTDTPFLTLDDVHTYYGDSHILHGITLTIQRGETVSLMGRNGMGKTTTIRSLFGLTAPRQGTITINGANVTGMAPQKVARKGLALVPEGRGIFPNLSVRENLIMAARAGIDGRTEWDYDRVLKTFPRLAERLSNMGNQLSGGEQQMLAIGRALMTNPDLLILDEATEGLAPLIRKEIWSVINTVRATGIATLIVDKDLEALLEISDSCVILEKGQVAWSGSAESLAADPDIHKQYLGV